MSSNPASISVDAAPGDGYDPHAIQQKWQDRWKDADPFRAGGESDTRPRKYVLGMFPYLSLIHI